MRMSSEINDQLKKGWKLEAHWAARSAFWRLQYFTLPILNLNISNISNIPLFGHSQALRSSESEVSSNRRKGMELFKSVPSAALPSNSIKLSRSEVKRLTSAGLEADKRWWVQRTSAVANAAIPSASVAVRRQAVWSRRQIAASGSKPQRVAASIAHQLITEFYPKTWAT